MNNIHIHALPGTDHKSSYNYLQLNSRQERVVNNKSFVDHEHSYKLKLRL